MSRSVEGPSSRENPKIAALPMVSVIVPIRNEEKYIGRCLDSLLSQSYPEERYEVIVVDGRSSDRSLKIVEEIASDHLTLRWIDNPGGIASAAMNIGIRNAKGEIVIRADGHNFYPTTYIETSVRCLDETGADNVGGPWQTVVADESFGARLVVAILTNPFGVGDSKFRIGSKKGFVETVPFGAFRRELFDRIGMYNERLVRNQDNELNARIRRHGGKIYQTPELTTEYHPVARYRDLLLQIFRQTQWHAFSVRETRTSMRLRHFAPALLVLGFAVLCCLSLLNAEWLMVSISVTILYFCIGLLFAVRKARQFGAKTVCVLPFAFACFHFAYGWGTLVGLRYLFQTPSAGPIRSGHPIEEHR